MMHARFARRSVRLFVQDLEDRNAPALFGPIDSAINVGAFPTAVATGDFNGDGRPDLAVANRDGHNVSIMLANGAAGFVQASGSPIGVGTYPMAVAVADFNGDGNLDFATANSGSGNIAVRLGDGNGTFSIATGSPITVGNLPESLAVGDLNSDGRPDIVVANYVGGDVRVLLGTGGGNFSLHPVAYANFSLPQSVAVGDWSGDGILDLAVANLGSNVVSILIGSGSGTFSAIGIVPVGLNPYSIAAGDWDGDGRLDLAIANGGGNNLSVLLGDGTGHFAQAPGSPISTGVGPYSVVTADFNGDGWPDLATANSFGNSSSVFVGLGGGAFSPAAGSPFAARDFSSSLAVADFNRDGLPDLVTANRQSNDLTFHLNQGATSTALSSSSAQSVYGQAVTFTAKVTSPSGMVVNGTVIFDDGDKQYSIPCVNGRAILQLSANILLPAGSYTFKAKFLGSNEFFSSTSNPLSQFVAQVATTTTLIRPDKTPAAGQEVVLKAIVSAAQPVIPTGSVTFFEGATEMGTVPLVNGIATLLWTFRTTGTREYCVQYRESDFDFASSISPPTPITVAGTADKIVTGVGAGAGPHVKVFNTDGTLQFSFFAYAPSFKGGVRVATGDVNGDGIADIITAPGSGAMPMVRVFDGYSGTELRAFFAYSPSFRGGLFVASGDVNGDGRAEIITSPGVTSNLIRVIDCATGGERFSLQAYPATFRGGVRVAAGDVNGDGKADIVVSPVKGAGVNVRVFNGIANPGTGAHDELFSVPPPFGAKFGGGLFVAVGDVNADPFADVIISSGAGLDARIHVVNGLTQQVIHSFSAYDPSFKGGVSVAAGDVNGDRLADIIVGTGKGTMGHVRVFDGNNPSVELMSFVPFDPSFVGGVMVG